MMWGFQKEYVQSKQSGDVIRKPVRAATDLPKIGFFAIIDDLYSQFSDHQTNWIVRIFSVKVLNQPHGFSVDF